MEIKSVGGNGRVECGRVIDTRDPKWAHPELSEGWTTEANPMSVLWNPDIPSEQKKAMVEGIYASVPPMATSDFCEVTEYEVDGCPEEPETKAKVIVVSPKKKRAKMRTVFQCLGGATVTCCPGFFPIASDCEKFNAIFVIPVYRTSVFAKYPAALNDCHAAYQWMINNAEMLHVDTKKIVIYGGSSGGHLATTLPFRLKRYGFEPCRGVVATIPITDDRGGKQSNLFYNGGWDGFTLHDTSLQYMGRDFASENIGPEAFANHATVEDCIGYPPLFLHTLELDPDRDSNREFVGKVMQAQTFTEYHSWGGADHSSMARFTECDYGQRIWNIIHNNVLDCFKYDFRRPWLYEENK